MMRRYLAGSIFQRARLAAVNAERRGLRRFRLDRIKPNAYREARGGGGLEQQAIEPIAASGAL